MYHAIYKNSNVGTERETECGKCLLGFMEIFQKILGSFIILTFPGILLKIPGMSLRIPGTVQEASEECSKRLRGMFKKNRRNLQYLT